MRAHAMRSRSFIRGCTRATPRAFSSPAPSGILRAPALDLLGGHVADRSEDRPLTGLFFHGGRRLRSGVALGAPFEQLRQAEIVP